MFLHFIVHFYANTLIIRLHCKIQTLNSSTKYIPKKNNLWDMKFYLVPMVTKVWGVISCIPLQEVLVPDQRVSWLPDRSGLASVCCSVMASSLCHHDHYAQTLLCLAWPFPEAEKEITDILTNESIIAMCAFSEIDIHCQWYHGI